MTPDFVAFDTREAAAGHVAALIEGALRQSLGATDGANLLVSGGSTPGPVFEQLSQTSVDWRKVTVGLVDERFVPADDPRSNAGLVHRTLLQGEAATATFQPMYREGEPIALAAEATDLAYRQTFDESPVLLLGMGSDGHTASWFPGVPGLPRIMDARADQWVLPVDARNAPVAGEVTDRLTLTGAAFDASAFAILFITGEDKRKVLEDRSANLPIHHAERLLGTRLKEVWAP